MPGSGRACLIFFLTVLTKESPSVGFAHISFLQRDPASRAFFFRMCLPVFFEHKCFFPFQEIKCIVHHFLYQLFFLFIRKIAHLAGRMHADPEEHFILENISCAGEYLLIEDSIANQGVRHSFQLQTAGHRSVISMRSYFNSGSPLISKFKETFLREPFTMVYHFACFLLSALILIKVK